MPADMLPLDGLTIVALEQAIAAPFATRHLADLGARVIKVERPGSGDFARSYDTTVNGLASHFVWVNRSKESLTLDLKREEARAVLRRLLARADVFIHNLAPGAVDRLGFGVRELREEFPALIVCTISGYGADGPFSGKKAYDLLIQSETGLLSITGTEESPSKVGIPVADIAAGMYAFSGILTALIARQQTGAGTSLEVSLFDALAEWMGYPLYYAAYGSIPLQRTGARHAAIVPYGPFTSGDGKVVYVAIQNEREWQRFCQVVLQSVELASDTRYDSNAKRVERRDEVERLVGEELRGIPADELQDRLDRAQIASARMNSIQEFLEHPQLTARGRWRRVDSPAGPLRALLPPVALEGIDPAMGPIPGVGQHTERILGDLGVDAATISAWKRDGIV
jgi:itaconate CoA-transferase